MTVHRELCSLWSIVKNDDEVNLKPQQLDCLHTLMIVHKGAHGLVIMV